VILESRVGFRTMKRRAAFPLMISCFVVTIALSLPGAVILAVENLRGVARPRAPELR